MSEEQVVSQEIPQELLALLPDNFDSNLITPEIKRFYLDNTEGVGVIEIIGDTSHYNRIDNPIVELFRAIEQFVRQDDPKALMFTAGCPKYCSATNTTTCKFYPNNVKKWGNHRLQVKTEQILLHKIGPLFKDLLRDYFAVAFKEYQVYVALLDRTGDNKDQIDYIKAACNESIKAFIRERGYALPQRRIVIPANVGNEESLSTKARYNIDLTEQEVREIEFLQKVFNLA